jgi:hypothetical protein
MGLLWTNMEGKLAERVGFESTIELTFNSMQGTAGTVRHWKALENKLTDRKWIAANQWCSHSRGKSL